DLEMRENRQRREQALRHHAHVRTCIGSSDEDELLPLIHKAANDGGGVGAELLDQLRIDVELDDLALGVALERLVEGELPAIAQAQYLEDAAVGHLATNLLSHAQAHVLGDLLGTSGVRGDLGNRLKDEMQVADGDALGQQELENSLQAGIRDARGDD